MKGKHRQEKYNGPWFVVPCYGKREHSPYNTSYCVDCGLVFRKKNKVTGGPIFIGASGQTLKTKFRLLLRDGNLCHYCKKQFNEKDNPPTIDHVIPRSQGGANDISNYVLSCYLDNQRKGDMSRYDFLKLLEAEDTLENEMDS